MTRLPRHPLVLVLGLVLLWALAACAPLKPQVAQPDPRTYPMDAASIVAKTCEAPVAAKVQVSPSFKYGCFCGKGHPKFDSSELQPGDLLTVEQRAAMVRKYLSIAPVDSIDAACQQHDICWTRFGRSELSCNRAFVDELDRLRAAWNEKRNFWDFNSAAYRCHFLARDIAFAAKSVMEAHSEDSTADGIERWAKWIASPATLLYASVTVVGGAIESNYPKPGAPCLAPPAAATRASQAR